MNAGAAELFDDSTEDEKNKSVNYGKVSIALGKSKKAGINVLPPDINNSDLTFSPDKNRNAIIYGFKGIERVGDSLVKDIIALRPYSSMEDFLSKVKLNKTQMVSLIKSGAFDSFYDDREKAMDIYLDSIADKKKRITMQNMAMLIKYNLVPDELEFEVKLFNFNKYLKNHKYKDYYYFDSVSYSFYMDNFNIDSLIRKDERTLIEQSIWDSIYKSKMEPVRLWMKDNQEEILIELNNELYNEVKNKYADGDINKWDMDALGTYCHEHELKNLNRRAYGIVNFEDLSEEPTISSEFRSKDGALIRLYEVSRICGTIIDKDKNKSTVVILTPTMQVVHIKVWKNQYAKWDRQISKVNPDGTKTIIEKSFFSKGNKIIVTGIRRGDDFVPKKYKNTPSPLFEKIIKMDEDGFIIESQTERFELEE